jgi:dTDP-6-deoxy-L-talose 4-dehydrogenase (NAD+)
VGTAFCASASARGHEILELRRSGSAAPLPSTHVAEGTLESLPWRAIEAFAPEACVHLAWIVTPKVWLDSPENEKLARWSTALFEGLADRGVRHLVAAGSASEYAPSTTILSEESPLNPSIAPYVRSKIGTLRQLEQTASTKGMAWSWLRPFFAYGGNEHPERLIPALSRELMAGRPVQLHSPGSVKDFVFVDDVASAILHILDQGLGGVVNVGSGVGVSIREVAHELARLAGASPQMISTSRPAAPDPLPFAVADNRRLCGAGWRPQVPWRTGLRQVWHHWSGK